MLSIFADRIDLRSVILQNEKYTGTEGRGSSRVLPGIAELSDARYRCWAASEIASGKRRFPSWVQRSIWHRLREPVYRGLLPNVLHAHKFIKWRAFLPELGPNRSRSACQSRQTNLLCRRIVSPNSTNCRQVWFIDLRQPNYFKTQGTLQGGLRDPNRILDCNQQLGYWQLQERRS